MNPEDVPDGPLLIDTDVVSYWVAGRGQAQREGHAFSLLVAGHEQAVSFATYGELLANAHMSRWGQNRIEQLRSVITRFVILPYSFQVVELWARMHARLGQQLHRGGTNDLWTAACALAIDPQLPIVTNNLNDFQTIAAAFPDLRLIHPDL